MKIEDLSGVAAPLGHADRILLFGWWLHAHRGKATFMPTDISKCYDGVHKAVPQGSLGPYFAALLKNGKLLKNAQGYRLEGSTRADMEKKYGQNPITVQITAILSSLPEKLPNLAERQYLDEALMCYRAGSTRGAIVMTWNLAYAHLCDHIVKKHLSDFNIWWQQQYKGDHKNKIRAIAKSSDFADEELNEGKVLKIAHDSGIIVKNIYNVLQSALTRRNAAAHPNNVSLSPLQTDAYIEDLIKNAVLQISS